MEAGVTIVTRRRDVRFGGPCEAGSTDLAAALSPLGSVEGRGAGKGLRQGRRRTDSVVANCWSYRRPEIVILMSCATVATVSVARARSTYSPGF